jgi:hypothetical protein
MAEEEPIPNAVAEVAVPGETGEKAETIKAAKAWMRGNFGPWDKIHTEQPIPTDRIVNMLTVVGRAVERHHDHHLCGAVAKYLLDRLLWNGGLRHRLNDVISHRIESMQKSTSGRL